MGNNLGGVSLRNYVHFPYRIQLGRYTAIDATEKINDSSFNKHKRKVTVTYTVDGSIYELELSAFPSIDKLVFKLRDVIPIGPDLSFFIRKDDNDLLQVGGISYEGEFSNLHMVIKGTETCNPWGDVTKTNVVFYGSGSKGCLLVTEQKIKSGDMKPYKVIVAHYYAASSGNIFLDNKIDVGLSMILHIQRSSNDFDITVEGPVQHPSSALFYMFEHVCKTGFWKPMACPHCSNQRQSSGKIWQSESEDSDSLPPARLHGPKQNATSVLANDGAVRGNNNGNLFVRKFIYGGRHLK